MSNYIAGGGCCPSCCQAPDLGDHDYCSPCTCNKPLHQHHHIPRSHRREASSSSSLFPDRHLSDEQFHRNEQRRELHYQTHLFQQQQAREAAAEKESARAAQRELEKQQAKDKKKDKKKKKKGEGNETEAADKEKDKKKASCTAI
ncbi:hypothetical protein CP533_4314 [Ophiocordyceps camponoti-saundersi (nom. inval.)]|nr:hypothetical protein CP533_4314 [Ophiocordyceps camponoti-saundersi (nom. inval.)]